MNAKTQANTAVFEQVYTSASALLDRTHGDLGVVCETVGFPREIQTDLDRLNSYQPLESRSGESPDKHPPAYTLSSQGPQGSFYSISRTVFAGADHTGRTNPLAHHFVVPTEAVRGDSAPADLLHSLSSLFLFRWDSVPRRLEHPRDVSIVKRLESGQSFPSAAWLRLASGKRVAEILGFFAEQMTSSAVSADVSVVFVIPSTLGDDVCHLLADLLAVLPAYAAFTISARTHVLSPPSIAGQCRVMFTYSNTAFLIQARRRQDVARPVIIDLAGGESSELQFKDYGRKLERALIAGASAHDIKLLVDLRSQMGVVQESGGTPFSDFISLQQQLKSPELMRDVDAILPLLDNVARASKAAETVAAGLLAKGIVGHFNARKGKSDWHALATLAFSNGVPDKPQQLAGKAIEQCIARSLPVIFEHPLLGGESAGRIQKWLQKCVDRKGIVSSILQHAAKHPMQQNVDCVRQTFRDLKPNATPDDFCDWVGIFDALEGPTIQPIRKLIGEFAALKAETREIDPLTLMRAIPQIIDNCEESDRYPILFRLVEASATTNQLGEFVRLVVETYGADGEFITGYDVSKHSSIVRSAIKYVLAPPDSQNEQLRRKTPPRDVQPELPRDPLNAFLGGTTSQTRIGSRHDIGSSVGTLKSVCWWGLAVLMGFILVALLIFMLDFKEWWPMLRRPKSGPTVTQWQGLLAFPLSALFFGIMYWLVGRNADPTRLGYSVWYLVAALVAMFAGTASTLYAGFQWLHR